MFTGIITDVGRIIELEQRGDLRARISTSYDTENIDLGASIACDGVCLTVIELGHDWFEVEVSAETVSKTILGLETQKNPGSTWGLGKLINLERSLRIGDELGGHIVTGHIDGVANVMEVENEGDSTRVVLEAPRKLMPFIASKGSVALNGTSLTVNAVDEKSFGINFIPHTKKVTTWGNIKVGQIVNLEIDTIARYVSRLQNFST